MTRATMVLSGLCLLVLFLGTTLFPANPTMWLAGASTAYNLLRAVLMLVLLIPLITTPRRPWMFRVIIGLVAISVLIGTLIMTYGGTMRLLDTLSLTAASVSIAASALEISYDDGQFVDIELLRRAKRYHSTSTL
jgi:hypothetical protein